MTETRSSSRVLTRGGWLCGGVFGGLIVLTFLVVTALSMFEERCKWSQPSSTADIEAEAGPVIAALENYRATHGRYPQPLSLAGQSDTSSFGPWRYTCDQQGTSYELGVGDYNACLWESTYISGMGSWYHDS
jgi:hypothetical protein